MNLQLGDHCKLTATSELGSDILSKIAQAFEDWDNHEGVGIWEVVEIMEHIEVPKHNENTNIWVCLRSVSKTGELVLGASIISLISLWIKTEKDKDFIISTD